MPHGVLAALSEDARVQRVQGSWQSHSKRFGKWVPVLGNRLFGLPREGDEVVETADVGQLVAGLQSVVGPEVQLRDVFQKAPNVATGCPVAVSEQREDASVGH